MTNEMYWRKLNRSEPTSTEYSVTHAPRAFRRLRITRTYPVQMSKIDIIIENEAIMYALSANVPKSYR